MSRLIARACATSVLAAFWFSAAVFAQDKSVEERKLLSDHQTVARFEGLSQRKCMGLTSRCPDDCGHSGEFASFKILAYIKYEKTGEYGDPKAKTFVFQVQDNKGNLKVPAELAEKTKALKSGDYVLLDWKHEYVTSRGPGGSGSYPERPIVRLEKITQEQADKLIKSAE